MANPTEGTLSGKVAVITGSAGGIGAETARVLVSRGAQVVLADRDLDRAQAVAAELGAAAVAIEFDATDEASIRAVIEHAVATFGGLDILHNNVARTSEAWSSDTNVLDTSLEVWDSSMDINLRSTFIASKVALPHLIERGGGAIVNMASGAGLRGSPGLTAYGTTKGGIIALTRYLAVQYGRDNVRTNALAPGVIATEQLLENAPDLEKLTLPTLPFHRVGTARDVANVVAFLVSDESAFINGQTIAVDGGGTAGTAAPR